MYTSIEEFKKALIEDKCPYFPETKEKLIEFALDYARFCEKEDILDAIDFEFKVDGFSTRFYGAELYIEIRLVTENLLEITHINKYGDWRHIKNIDL